MATHTVLTSRIDRITALKKRLGLSKASQHGEVCFIYLFTLRTCLLLCFQGVFHILLNHYSRRGVISAATKNFNFYLASLLNICNNPILSRVLLIFRYLCITALPPLETLRARNRDSCAIFRVCTRRTRSRTSSYISGTLTARFRCSWTRFLPQNRRSKRSTTCAFYLHRRGRILPAFRMKI